MDGAETPMEHPHPLDLECFRKSLEPRMTRMGRMGCVAPRNRGPGAHTISALPIVTRRDSLHELIEQWNRERRIAVTRTPNHALDD